jgi:hypothetical protein
LEILQSFSGKENPHHPRQGMSAKGRYQYGQKTTAQPIYIINNGREMTELAQGKDLYGSI